jgi:hypothetical protein
VIVLGLGPRAKARHCFTYIGPPNGPIQRPKLVKRQVCPIRTNAMKQLRGPKHENWPACDPRAAPPGEYGLKSGENGHLARSPTWPGVFGRRCEPLAGRGGGFGGGAAPAPAHAARGALLQFEWLSKTRGAQAFRAWRGSRPGTDPEPVAFFRPHFRGWVAPR